MHTLVAVMLTTLAAKLLVEGVHTLPKYCKTRGMTTLGELKHCPTVLSAVQATCHVHTLMYWEESLLREGLVESHLPAEQSMEETEDSAFPHAFMLQ